MKCREQKEKNRKGKEGRRTKERSEGVVTRHQEARGQLCLQYNWAYSIQRRKVMHTTQSRKAHRILNITG